MQLISIGQFHKVIEKYLYWLSLPSIGFTDILEIIIISVIVYQMLKWVQLNSGMVSYLKELLCCCCLHYLQRYFS